MSDWFIEKVSCSTFLKDYNWSHRLIGSGTYIGQNAFGVKKAVTYKKFENILIEVDAQKPDFTVPGIPPNDARLLLPNIRLLVIGHPVQPFAKSETVNYDPTLSNPSHVVGNNFFLMITLREVWLYNFETGKVLKKTVVSSLDSILKSQPSEVSIEFYNDQYPCCGFRLCRNWERLTRSLPLAVLTVGD